MNKQNNIRVILGASLLLSSAIAVADELDLPMERVADALRAFTGAARRFERTFDGNGIVVADDYGHHPTEIRATLAGSAWDLVIVDEAHKMAAYAYQGKNRTKIDKTKRYQAGEVLSRQADHLLFLTATPHKGNDENFRLFLDLLRPGFFAQAELLQQSAQEGDNPILIRRLKEDMRRFDGTKIFPPRHVRSVKFGLTPAELDRLKSVYAPLSQAIRRLVDASIRTSADAGKLPAPMRPSTVSPVASEAMATVTR